MGNYTLTEDEINLIIEKAKELDKGQEFSDLLKITYTNALRLVQVLSNVDKVIWKDIETKQFTLTKSEVFIKMNKVLELAGIKRERGISFHSIRRSRLHHIYEEMKTRITLWSIKSIKKDENGNEITTLKFNHIENGWSENNKPMPLSPEFKNQLAWQNLEWEREYKRLENYKVVSK